MLRLDDRRQVFNLGILLVDRLLKVADAPLETSVFRNILVEFLAKCILGEGESLVAIRKSPNGLVLLVDLLLELLIGFLFLFDRPQELLDFT